MKGYRFVTDDLKSEHGKVQWKVGEWQKQGGTLKLCENGFHASKDPLDSLNYIFGTRWFQVEARGKILHDNDKLCAEEMRLVQEIPIIIIKKFAIECAKHVLPFYEKQYPDDKRPRDAIGAAEKYLADPSPENLGLLKKCEAAAYAAAWNAAWTAAGDVAGDVARAAAYAAAWNAAGDAERKWQHKHLKQLIKEASS